MELLKFLHGVHKGKDEYIDQLFLMDNPVRVCTIVAAYFAFIFKIGPKLMENRKAFVLKKILMVYNIFQIIFSFFICVQVILSNKIVETLVNPDCRVIRNRQSEIAGYFTFYCYLLAKISDLLDTVFFVLRKKSNQITFLHVYHHVVMVLGSWAFLKYNPGEEFGVAGILNSFVHVLMYTYYLIAGLGPSYQKYLWWKKYMTTIQLLQFALIIFYLLAIILRGCNVSQTLIYFTIFNTSLFFYLFYDFYRKTYTKTNVKIDNKIK